jgi:hypothetical protein
MAVSSGSAPGVEGSRLVESRAGDISLAGVAAIGAVIPCSGVGRLVEAVCSVARVSPFGAARGGAAAG